MMATYIDEGYKINSWKYEAHVMKNNVWEVKETMDVTFNESRHGIYRQLPLHYDMTHIVNGNFALFNYETNYDDIEVETYDFTTDDSDWDNVIIRIGSEDEEVEGNHVYVISYTMQVPDDRYDAYDFLYTSVLGPDCNTTIDKFEFTLYFDKPLPESALQSFRVFSGKYGSSGNDLQIDPYVTSNTISGSAYNIEPFNAITLRAEMDNGYWEDAYKVSPVWFYLFFTLTAVFFGVILVRFIRNRRSKPLVVIEYGAPDNISSAEVGVIIDNQADVSDLASLIVWFASKGYLKIREIPGEKHILKKDDIDIELVKLKELPSDLPKYQKEFWGVLFKKNKDKVVLSKLGDCHVKMNRAIEDLGDRFTGEQSLTDTSYRSICYIFAFFLCGTAAINFSCIVSTFNFDLVAYLCVTWVGFCLVASFFRMWRSNYDMIAPFYKKAGEFLVYILTALFAITEFQELVYSEYDMFVPVEVLMGIMIAGWIIVLFSGRVKYDSKYRLEMMSRLLGFREFIEKSELPMLKAQVDENPSFFYDVLPYAMVFGLTDKWAKKFKELSITQPSWYENANDIASDMLVSHICSSLTNNIGHSISVCSHDTTSHRSSSGGSSGGFSGGGSGGGGCGSW